MFEAYIVGLICGFIAGASYGVRKGVKIAIDTYLRQTTKAEHKTDFKTS